MSTGHLSHLYKKIDRLGGSPGLVVMGGDSCSKGHGFESQRRILDGHFFTVVRIVLFVWKDGNKWKRGRGWHIFKKKDQLKFFFKLPWGDFRTSLWSLVCRMPHAIGTERREWRGSQRRHLATDERSSPDWSLPQRTTGRCSATGSGRS